MCMMLSNDPIDPWGPLFKSGHVWTTYNTRGALARSGVGCRKSTHQIPRVPAYNSCITRILWLYYLLATYYSPEIRLLFAHFISIYLIDVNSLLYP